MTTFVHIADERDTQAIKRSGIRLARHRAKIAETEFMKMGVFAMPVTPNFLVTHQWVRELKRRGFRVASGVYFRIPDDELVWAGRYNQAKQRVAASEAAAILRREELLGFEVIIPRGISAGEVIAVRALPQGLGWRHFPGANGSRPFCGCEYCQRGSIKGRRLRDEYERSA